jgi:hypothetical protein
MKTTYTNRYGDKIQFEDKGDIVEMSGYFDMGMRYGWKDDPNVIDMVDPSGGPYITIGSDLCLFFEDKKSRIVKAIDISSDVIKFTI